jgi:hypothetical protein
MLGIHQLRLVGMNLLTNEMMNMGRYDHFKITQGGMHVGFFNPFNKGSTMKNCLDFWWFRRRSVMPNEGKPPTMADVIGQPGHGHGHQHGAG